MLVNICSVCPPCFTPVSAVNGCYAVVTDNKEWLDADLTCKRLHQEAHLVFINDEAEQTAISRLLDSHSGKQYMARCKEKGHGVSGSGDGACGTE